MGSMGNCKFISMHSQPQLAGQLHTLITLTPEKNPRYSFGIGLDGPLAAKMIQTRVSAENRTPACSQSLF
jgi:hypothetical protein